MVALLVRLKLTLLKNSLKRSTWRTVGLIIAMVYALIVVSLVIAGLVGLRFTSLAFPYSWEASHQCDMRLRKAGGPPLPPGPSGCVRGKVIGRSCGHESPAGIGIDWVSAGASSCTNQS